MRYRLTKSPRKIRGQVLTPAELAHCLAKHLTGTDGSWLELGIGTGRIAAACLDLRSASSYLGVEIDSNLAALMPKRKGLRIEMGDVLSPQSLAQLLGDQRFDRTAGNPPFGLHALGEACRDRITSLCPGLELSAPWVPLDLYFVLESLSRLKPGGEAAFIVASSIAEDSRLRAFRSNLIQTASEVECYELPERMFGWKAQVQSYLLIARFGNAACRSVTLGRLAAGSLEVESSADVPPAAAINRLDFAFHEFTEMNRALRESSCTSLLSELGAVIVRGSRTKTQFDDLQISSFHTSDLPRAHSKVRFDEAADHGFNFAQPGDILIARVGTRCLDRHAIVASGRRHYTEAVYRIQVPRPHRQRVAEWMASEAGAKWRQAAATGACAKHLTVSTLLKMPIPR
jgi:hypothetical protein